MEGIWCRFSVANNLGWHLVVLRDISLTLQVLTTCHLSHKSFVFSLYPTCILPFGFKTFCPSHTHLYFTDPVWYFCPGRNPWLPSHMPCLHTCILCTFMLAHLLSVCLYICMLPLCAPLCLHTCSLCPLMLAHVHSRHPYACTFALCLYTCMLTLHPYAYKPALCAHLHLHTCLWAPLCLYLCRCAPFCLHSCSLCTLCLHACSCCLHACTVCILTLACCTLWALVLAHLHSPRPWLCMLVLCAPLAHTLTFCVLLHLHTCSLCSLSLHNCTLCILALARLLSMHAYTSMLALCVPLLLRAPSHQVLLLPSSKPCFACFFFFLYLKH